MNPKRRRFVVFLAGSILLLAPGILSAYSITVHYQGTCEHQETHRVCHTVTDEDGLHHDECHDEVVTVSSPCTKTATMNIPDSISPEEVQNLANELGTGGQNDVKVTFGEQTPTDLGDKENAAATDVNSLDDLRDQLSAIRADMTKAKNIAENGGRATTSPDPVRFATGDLTSQETDVAYKYLNGDVKISRFYQPGTTGTHSFGPGWSFNYDTRVILGTKLRAEDEVAAIQNTVDQVQTLYDDATTRYNNALSGVRSALNRARQIQNQINDTIANLQSALSSADSKFHQALSDDLSNAQSKKQIVDAFVARAEAAEQGVLDSHSIVDSIHERLINLQAELLQAQKEAAVSAAQGNRNQFVVDSGDPAYFYQSGISTITLIDEAGTPHTYRVSQTPDYESTKLYPDGSINYFPTGSETRPVLPNDDRVSVNPDGTYTRTRKDGVVFSYNFDGKLASVVDTNGNKTALDYSTAHQLQTITDDFSRTISIQRDSAGRIVTVVDPANRQYQYSYDGTGHLASVTDAVGDTVRYEYSGNLLTGMIKPDGSSRRFLYATVSGKPVAASTVDEEGNADHFAYYPDQGFTEYTSRGGVVDRYYNDDRLRTTRIVHSDGTEVDMQYDDADNLIKSIDELGNVSTFTYDDRHNRTSATDQEGYSEHWIYNDLSKITSYTDKAGRTTSYQYDNAGNLLSVTYPDSTRETYTYTSRGLMATATDRRGNTTTYEYNNDDGYLAAAIDPTNARTAYDTDVVGNVTGVTDPAGNTTQFAYNNDNRVVTATDANGKSTHYTFNNRKDLISYTDQADNKTMITYDKRHLVVQVKNPLGETVAFTYRGDGKVIRKLTGAEDDPAQLFAYQYDARANVVQRTEQLTGTRWKYEYDAANRLVAATDPNGNRTEYTLDPIGRPVAVHDPLGHQRQFTYMPTGKVASATDFSANKTSYTYNDADRLIRAVDALSQREQFDYDANGNLVTYTDKAGNAATFAYDADNRVIKSVDADGNAAIREYDPRGLVSKSVDRTGAETIYAYDALGRLVSTTDALGGTVGYAYDALGNRTSVTNQNGNTITYQYDALSRIVKRIDAYQHPTIYGYDILGNVTTVTDALGNAAQYQYDALGRLTGETDPLGSEKQYSYDPNGNTVAATDEVGRKTLYEYDALNRLIAQTDPAGNRVQYSYDPNGNRTAMIDAKGATYGYQFDALNREVKETNRLGVSQSYQYDPLGNLVKKTDFKGAETDYSYDVLSRLTDVSFAGGESTDNSWKAFRYDAEGRVTYAATPDSELSYTYDALGRLTQSADSTLGQTLDYAYDAAGNRISLTRDHRKTSYGYGKMNEILSQTDPDRNTTSFSYDPLLREVERNLPNDISATRSYDAAGRLTAVVSNDSHHGFDRDKALASEAYLYNAAGQRTYTVDEDGNITAYQYDAAGRIAEVQYPIESGKPSTDFRTRLNMGLLPAYTDSHGTHGHGHANWDAEKWQPDVTVNIPTPPVPGFGRKELEKLTGDALKDAAKLVEEELGKAPEGRWQIAPGEGATQFATRLSVDSDTQNALQSAYHSLSSRRRLDTDPWMWTETFSYDANGNRTQIANGWGAIDASFDPENRITQNGKRTYSSDPNGNLVEESLNDITATYTYNPENRVVDISSDVEGFIGHHGNGTYTEGVAYSYDAFGRRISRTGYENGTSITGRHEGDTRQWKAETNTSFLYDGLSFQVNAEFRDSNYRGPNAWVRRPSPLQFGRGEFDRSFVSPFGSRSSGRFEPVSEYQYANGELLSRADYRPGRGYGYRAPRPEDVVYYQTDILGSVMATSDEHGRESGRYRYDAWGVAYEGSFDLVNTAGYNGERYDVAVGTYDYGYRDYEPATGRWTSEDPIRAGLNWYAYVNADPVNLLDSLGLTASDSQSAGNGTAPEPSGVYNTYNEGITKFHYNQFVYTPIEGVGVTGSYTVSGYVDVTKNPDSSYTASVTALGASPGASNAGEVTFYGNVEITSNGKTVYTAPLTQPTEPYFSSADSSMIGTADVPLPPQDLVIDFQANLNAGYVLKVPEGTYASPTMHQELPVFKAAGK